MLVKNWTEEQINFIKLYYPTEDTKWCVERIGKTQPQIRFLAKKLGLEKKKVYRRRRSGELKEVLEAEIQQKILPTVEQRRRLQYLLNKGVKYNKAFDLVV